MNAAYHVRVTDQLPDASRISSLLDPSGIFDEVRVVATTGSTNHDVSALARGGAGEGLVLVSGEQTAGRGRLDRSWVSPPGASIAMSLLLKPLPAFPQWGWLSLLAGMAVASAVEDLAPDPTDVTLKWPNDVLLRGDKLCGILSERIEHADGARAVVGIGINVSLTRDQLPVPAATSLALAGLPTDRDVIVAGVLNHFSRYYRQWSLSGSLREEYQASCASIGAELTIVVDEHRRVHGIGRGIDAYGRLEVATARGVEIFAVGDVVHARLQA